MLFAILIYGSETEYADLSPEEESALMGRHADLRRDLDAKSQLGPFMRLKPDTVRTVRRYKDRRFVTDGPFAETKEQLMGIYVVDCPGIEDVYEATDRLDFENATFEIRPLTHLDAGTANLRHVPTDS
jgi:hypothetical protein